MIFSITMNFEKPADSVLPSEEETTNCVEAKTENDARILRQQLEQRFNSLSPDLREDFVRIARINPDLRKIIISEEQVLDLLQNRSDDEIRASLHRPGQIPDVDVSKKDRQIKYDEISRLLGLP